MQFTKAEEYGVLGILYLAETNGTRVIPLSEISQAQSIPEKFLAKIFQSLAKNGLVRSHRGVRGGFTLAKPPEEITLKDILETIQGPYHLMKCTENPENCDRDPGNFCALREVLIITEKKLAFVFGSFTLAELATWQRTQKRPNILASI